MTDQVAVEMGDVPDGQRDLLLRRNPQRENLKVVPANGSSARTPDATRRRINRGISEADDIDDRPDDFHTSLGVDDGLLDGGVNKRNPNTSNGDAGNGALPRRRPSFGYPTPGTVMIDGVETQIPDVNAYQHKKTLAQGMMDLALLSANANQLRYVLESYRRHPYFYPSIIFISLSIIFQVAVGVGLILNSRYNIKDQKEICKANKISNMTIIGIFIVTVVNVFISSFGVADAPDAPPN